MWGREKGGSAARGLLLPVRALRKGRRQADSGHPVRFLDVPPLLSLPYYSTLLVDALRTAGLEPIVPEGGFFIIADTSNIQVPPRYLGESTPASPNPMSRDWAFCRYLTLEAGVAAIPPSAFYKEEHKHLAKNHARFAFCKADASIVEAKARFLRWRGKDEAGAVGLENGNGKEEA